jgi:prophage antirepressor-like protein
LTELSIVNQQEVLGKNFRVYGSLDEPLFLAKDVAEWIEYNVSNVSKLVNVVDEDEKVRSIVTTLGGSQESWFLTEDGLYEVLMQSRKPIAKVFKKEVKAILRTIRHTGHYETPEYKAIQELIAKQDHMEQLLLDSGILRTFVNPRYTFKRLNVRYRIVTNDDSKRGIYEAIGNYFGFHVPFSNTLPIALRDWVLQQISEDPQKALDAVQEFIVGMETATIVKGIQGNWVNLNGFGSNDVEYAKVLKAFGHQCAYCGTDAVPLIPEHIVSQSYLAQSNPEAVDLIGNIVPSCGRCNASKNRSNVDEWYPKQPYYKPWKLERIHRHQSKYRI